MGLSQFFSCFKSNTDKELELTDFSVPYSRLDLLNDAEFTDFLNAIEKKNCTAVKDYLKKHPDHINSYGKTFDFPLIVASITDDSEIFQLLLSRKKIDLTVINRLGNNALMMAIDSRREQHVEALLNAKKPININAKNSDGETALMMAVRHNSDKIVSMLLNANADISIPDKNEKTALQIAEDLKNESIVNLLQNHENSYRPRTPGLR